MPWPTPLKMNSAIRAAPPLEADRLQHQLDKRQSARRVHNPIHILHAKQTDDHEDKPRDSTRQHRQIRHPRRVDPRSRHLLDHMDDRVKGSKPIRRLHQPRKPHDPITPTRLVHPGPKDKPPWLKRQVRLGANRNQQRKRQHHKQPGEPHSHKPIQPRQDLLPPTPHHIHPRQNQHQPEINHKLQPAGPGPAPLLIKHHLHPQQKLGHKRNLRRRERPPPERVDPRTQVRHEPPRRRMPQPVHPVRLPERRRHATRQFAQRHRNTKVTDRHQDQTPEDRNGTAVGQPAAEALRESRVRS